MAINGLNEITNIIILKENVCAVYNSKLIYFEALHWVSSKSLMSRLIFAGF